MVGTRIYLENLFMGDNSNRNQGREQKCSHFLFVCFVALRPKLTAMVIAGRSVHLTTLFPGQA